MNDKKTAIVTGGAKGLGKAICETLASPGTLVVVADMEIAKARDTADSINGRGGEAVAMEVNIADEASVLALYQAVKALSPTVDILVNNAGIGRELPILDITVAEWDRIFAVNMRGTFLMSREAFRVMKEQGSGKIISIASAAGKIGGLVAGAHYSASKAGVICFTKSLAMQAAAFKINVNAVCPGPIATDMTAIWGEETIRATAEKIPWKEFGRPQDVADAVAFLASEKSRYITGEILDVNGGFVMD